MSFPQFGEVIEQAAEPGSFPEYGKTVEVPSRFRSLINATAAGSVEKAGDIAQFVQNLAPFIPKGPLNKEKAYKYSEENLPYYEKEPERFLKRVGSVGTEALLSPGGLGAKAIQIPVGSALGYATEKMGAPEWAQAIAESLPFFYSGGKKIPLKPQQKKLGDFLRKQGLTEEEITPLLKTPEQINRWSAYASKGKKSRKLMESVYQKSGKIYDSIIDEGKNLSPLSQQAKTDLINEMTPIWQNMPHKYRSLIKEDLKDFLTKGRAGAEDIINFDRDINAVIGAEKGGKAMVGQFKGPINKALSSINSSLGEDYSLAKQLYATRAKVKGSLVNPKDFDKFMDLGEAYGLAQGITNRDFGMIAKVVGVAGGRKIAREMLINPRLQNIATRMGEALKKNKYMLTEKLMREFKEEMSKEETRDNSVTVNP